MTYAEFHKQLMKLLGEFFNDKEVTSAEMLTAVTGLEILSHRLRQTWLKVLGLSDEDELVIIAANSIDRDLDRSGIPTGRERWRYRRRLR